MQPLDANNDDKKLRRFLRCLEFRRVRLVDRAWQRAFWVYSANSAGGLLGVSGGALDWIEQLERVVARIRH